MLLYETFATEYDTKYNKELIKKLFIPTEVKEELLAWRTVIKSYLGNDSFYSGKQKDWAYTEDDIAFKRAFIYKYLNK